MASSPSQRKRDPKRMTTSINGLWYMVTNASQDEITTLEQNENLLEKLKQELTVCSKNTFALEKKLKTMEEKIALLIRNRISIAEFDSDFDTLKANGATNLGVIDKQSIPFLSELYFLLQEDSAMLSRLIQVTPKQYVPRIINIIMHSLYGTQFDRDIDNKLLTLMLILLKRDLKAYTSVSTALRENSPVTKMMSLYAQRPPGRQYLKSVVSQKLQEICDIPNLNLEVNPVSVYQEYINAKEISSGVVSNEKRILDMENASIHPTVVSISKSRFKLIIHFAQQIFDILFDTIDELPFGIRWLAQQIYNECKSQFPDAQESQLLILVGGFIFLRFLGPAFVGPHTIGLVVPGKLEGKIKMPNLDPAPKKLALSNKPKTSISSNPKTKPGIKMPTNPKPRKVSSPSSRQLPRSQKAPISASSQTDSTPLPNSSNESKSSSDSSESTKISTQSNSPISKSVSPSKDTTTIDKESEKPFVPNYQGFGSSNLNNSPKGGKKSKKARKSKSIGFPNQTTPNVQGSAASGGLGGSGLHTSPKPKTSNAATSTIATATSVSAENVAQVTSGPVKLSKIQRRNFVLVAKTLQNLSNGVFFKSGKEPFLAPLDEFLNKNHDKMKTYLKKIITVSDLETRIKQVEMFDQVKGKRSIQVSTTFNEIQLLHTILIGELPRLLLSGNDIPEDQLPDPKEQQYIIRPTLNAKLKNNKAKLFRRNKTRSENINQMENTQVSLSQILETIDLSKYPKNQWIAILKRLPDSPYISVPRPYDKPILLSYSLPVTGGKNSFQGSEEMVRKYTDTKNILLRLFASIDTFEQIQESGGLIDALVQANTYALDSKNTDLANATLAVLQNLEDLTESEFLDPENDYLQLRKDVALHLHHRNQLAFMINKDLSVIQDVHKSASAHLKDLQSQFDFYQVYLNNVRRQSYKSSLNSQTETNMALVTGSSSSLSQPQGVSTDHFSSKKKKKKIHNKDSHYRYSHVALEKDHIIIDSKVPKARRPNLLFDFSCPSPGIFQVALYWKSKTSPVMEMDLTLDDLLEKQNTPNASLHLDHLDLHVNMLLHLLDKHFGCLGGQSLKKKGRK